MTLFQQVKGKFRTLVFHVLFARLFKQLGKGAFLFAPFRLDGAGSIHIGDKTVFQSGVWLYCESSIEEPEPVMMFGSHCVFGYNNHITAVRHVEIGDYVLTANNVYISDNVHEYEDIHTPIIEQPVKFKRKVCIGSGSWIGENVCIIAASIGRNCVIGANAVVTKDIPDYSVAVGNPARVIKQYDESLRKWVSMANRRGKK